jgi:hypothetical protein
MRSKAVWPSMSRKVSEDLGWLNHAVNNYPPAYN